MQESAREEFPLLNGEDAASHATVKDICPTLMSRATSVSPHSLADTALQRLGKDDNNEVITVAPVKLEDINTIDLFPSNTSSSWQHYQIHDLGNRRQFTDTGSSFQHKGTNLLLQGSDDPLISHGANSVLTNDDEQLTDFAATLTTQRNNQFENIISQQENEARRFNTPEHQQQQQQQPTRSLVKSGCSSLTRQQLKAKANLMSARNQQQLQRQQQQQLQQQQQHLNQNYTPMTETPTAIYSAQAKHQQRSTHKGKNKRANTLKLRFHHQALPPEYLSHYEATQGQQRPATKNSSNSKTMMPRNLSKSTNNLPKPSHARNSHENVRSWLQKIAEIQRAANASKESNNSALQKPPENQRCFSSNAKTNECHNNSQRLPTDANNNLNIQKRLELPQGPHLKNSSASGDYGMADDRRRSPHYSELPYMGEITLDNSKPRRGRKPKKADICHLIYKNYGTILPRKTEPAKTRLNYAANNLEQPLNLCLRDQVSDAYSISSGDELSETNSSCPTPVTTPFDAVRDAMLSTNLKKSLVDINEQNTHHEQSTEVANQTIFSSEKDTFAQPITLCLKKLLDSGLLLHNGNGRYKTIRKDNQLALKIPIPSGSFFPTGRPEKYTDKQSIVNTDYDDATAAAGSNQTECGGSSNQNQPIVAAGPQKRKRSAIFIPPMNVENTNNPATEVSICKFKFTGGSKPSLEEKKMISVDAGGNYRYFSGTGDKASRGFEYFPREVLQHTAGLLPGVNCTGHKPCHDIVPPPSQGLDHDLLQIPDATATSVLLATGRNSNINTECNSPLATSPPFEATNNKSQTLYGT